MGAGLPVDHLSQPDGEPGTGKTVLAPQYVQAAVSRGERVRMYLFDERVTTFRMRSGATCSSWSSASSAR